MRVKNWITLIIAVSLTLMALANTSGPTVWAAPGSAPVWQGGTVPTKTPIPIPTQPTTPPESQATPVPAAQTPTAGGAPALLPVAGGGSNDRLAVLSLAGLSVLALAWAVRRRGIGRA